MRTATICLPLALGLASVGVMAQAAGDSMEKLKACSSLAPTERLECLDRLSREVSPSPERATGSSEPGPAPAADNWVVSETTSPVDYTPVVVATATAGAGPNGAILQLAIQCRGGNTALVLGGPSVARVGEGPAVTYAINDGQAVALAAAAPASGPGLAIAGDVARLLASLPDQGAVAFRVAGRQAATLEGRYSLSGLKLVRERLAVPCKWPAASGAPRR